MIWVISELYYPEEAGTAHYLTLIAEGVAAQRPVSVACARPKYDQQLSALPSQESHNGVRIYRCWCTTLDKNRFFYRLVNVLSTSISLFVSALFRLKRGERVLVVTNPPLLPFVVAVACLLRGAKCYLRIDDVYPEAMICAGLLQPQATTASVLNALNRWLYRHMDGIVVLGRDMAKLVKKKLGKPDARVVIISNWADLETVVPAPREENRLLKELGLEMKFVLGYAGNIGRVQGIEALLAAAVQMRKEVDVHFLFIGSGYKVPWLTKSIAEAGLTNVTFLGQRPRAEQSNFLNAADVGLVSLVSGMSGAGVPSRVYNLMAAGKPVIAAVDPDSEIALVINEERIGWVVAPNAPGEIVRAILEARADRRRLIEMGKRAREVAERKYSPEHVVNQYQRLLSETG
jgi:colanic acid biosynthesis glycosyl transferase WcaI